MVLDENLRHIISTALQVGDFDIALRWLEGFSSDHNLISELTLPDQRTPLHYACQHGRVDVAQRLVTNCKCSIESRDAQGRTPLHTAAQYGQVETLKYLLHRLFDHEVSGLTLKLVPGGKLSHTLTSVFQQKLSDRHRDKNGNTPLHTAFVHGQLDIVQLLTREIGCDPNNTNNEGLSCLHLAAQHGHLPLVRYLVEELGSDVTLEDEHGKSPTYLAARGGNLDILMYLIEEKGADLQLKTGRSLVRTASREGHLHVVRYLVEHHGCNPSTPLHLACTYGHIDIVSYLLTERHCDPNCTNEGGSTCLHAASIGGRLDVIKYLHIYHNCQIQRDSYGWTPLHYTASHGKLDILKYLIEDMKCDPNTKGVYERTPLHLASERGQLDVVKYLVATHRCDPLCPDVSYKTPLHCAAATGQLVVMMYFEFILTNFLARDKYNDTPLHDAALYGHAEVVKFLIEDMKCDPNSKGTCERTPLHHASKTSHLDVVKYFIDTHHCDPLCPDKDEQTPLHMAAANGQLDVIRYFILTLQSNFLVRDKHDSTPLHFAALCGHVEVVKFLTQDLRCDPNCKDIYGSTPLHHASGRGHLDVVKYLVDTHHCNPLCPDEDKQTPLHWAAATGQLEVVKYFIVNLHCNFLARDKHDNTPLHRAALCGHVEVVKFLTENMKCDPHCKGCLEKTPLHYASESGHLDIVKYLVDTHHCDPLCPNEDKQTPLHWAAGTGQLEVVRYFVLTQGCNQSVRDKYSNTPLHSAVINNQLEVLKFFIENINCDPNIRGEFDMTPLHLSLAKKAFDSCLYLIDLPHCDVLANVSTGFTDTNPLRLAVETQNLEMISYLCNTRRLDPHLQPDKEILLKAIKDPAILEFFNSYTDPLHYAAVYGDVQRVKHCVAREKWDPYRLDRYGNNTLHNAAQHGQLEVVKYLTGLSKDPISEGVEILCDPLVKNRYGLTAQDIASQNGHRHVVSYLLRATSNQPVFQQDVISPPLNIFVVGNSGSGKSTLVKALSAENSLLGGIIKVKGVIPLTAGIVPTILHSQVFGKVNIYDFAGHEEYYASHEMILCQTTQPLVLLAVDLSLTEEEIQKQILYWLTILTNSSSTDAARTTHVVIVGSHADQIKFKEKRDIYEQVSSLVSNKYFLKYHGFIQCDCRYSTSDNLNQLRLKLSIICRSIRLFLAHESATSNSLCAALMYHLKYTLSEQATITVSELHKLITDSLTPGSRLVPFVDEMLLLETCKKLSSSGHMLFLPHSDNEVCSVLVLDKYTILSKVHACLQPKKDVTNEIGVMEEEQLKRVLVNLLEDMMLPEQAIKYLIFSQFCTEITASQLISVPQSITGVVHYFFPNLVSASRPAEVLLLGDNSYTYFYTWGLKCTNSHQFLTPRYLHTLLIQLTKCEGDSINSRFIIWKNGILLVNNNGTRSIIEVTDQTTQLYLAMLCVKGCESFLVKQRSKLISLIKSLLHKICPVVKFREFLLLPQATFPLDHSCEIPLADIALSIIGCRPTVLFNYKNISIRDLLHFDPFHTIEELTLQELFRYSQCVDVVPPSILSTICSSIKEGCEALAKTLLDQAEMSYSKLYEEITRYSIFTDGNLFTLAGVPIPTSHDPETDELQSVSSLDPLTISDLYLVNACLVDVACPELKFGHALGLKQPTLNKIRYMYHQHIDRYFTEVLAAWLEREDRVHDSPDPNWEEIMAALKSVGMTDLARQIIQKLAISDDPENSTLNLVDNSELAPNSLGEVAEYVRDLNHKWFHLGLSLGLRYSTLKNIEHHHDGWDHMTDMLLKWLEGKDLETTVRGPPSWRSLAQALDCPLIRRSQVARRIQREHQIMRTL